MSVRYRYRFGAAVFDEAKQELIVGGLAVDIQQRPLQILSLLLARGGEVVTREEFFEKIWLGRPTVDNVLANAITKLRNALAAEGALVENVPRIGYRFAGRLERIPLARDLVSKLDLSKDGAVPHRPGWVLAQMLSQRPGHEVWLGAHSSGELRVYKFASDPEYVTALKREVTLARLLRDELGERADIVRIVGWDFQHAPAFLESEYGGRDLLAWATEDNRLAGLSVAERLDIVLQAADAVAAAHSVAVLHKDLKPENVLISPRAEGGWRVRLVDFGSGRLLEPERLAALGITSLGMTVSRELGSDATRGTLMYLAPELLQEQPATVRSDLYALGVLLYQLLRGDLRRALGPGWERDIADPLLREDLSRATDGDPALRASSVQEWATDLRRLEDRRIERSRLQAIQKQAELDQDALRRARVRRPWLVATFAALSLGLVVALVSYVQVLRAQRAVSAQYGVAAALNSFLIQNFISMANPASTGRNDITVIDASRNAATHIDQMFANAEPQVRGGLHAAMQEAFFGLSDFDRSIAEGRKALDALRSASPVDLKRIAKVHVELAEGLTESSKLEEASREADAAATIIKAEHLEQSPLAATYWYARAGIELDRLALPESVEDYRHAWELGQRYTELPADVRDEMQFYYADALSMWSHFTEAEREGNELLARQRMRLGAKHAATCRTGLLLASIRGYTHRVEEGIETARESATCLADRLGPDNLRTASAYNVLANLLFQSDRYKEAATAYDQVAHSYDGLLGPIAMRTIITRMNAAVSRQYAGEGLEAEKELAATLEAARGGLGWTHPSVENLRYHLADCRLDQHLTQGVGELLRDLSVAVLNAAQIEPDWDGRIAYENGRLALYSGDRKSAVALLQAAATVIAEKHPDGRVTETAIRKLIQAAQ